VSCPRRVELLGELLRHLLIHVQVNIKGLLVGMADSLHGHRFGDTRRNGACGKAVAPVMNAEPCYARQPAGRCIRALEVAERKEPVIPFGTAGHLDAPLFMESQEFFTQPVRNAPRSAGTACCVFVLFVERINQAGYLGI